ncbi:response regulator [Pedobacter cryoconitis]|nr:response regulator transcription factor [Pedobacter cryoconitis]
MGEAYSENVKILITDDHLVIRHGLSFVIKEFLPMASISGTSSLASTLQYLTNEKVNLLILDINMPGGNSFEMIEMIKEVQPDIKILLFSAYDEEIYGLRYLKTGVNGYLAKNASEKEIQDAVIKVLSKGKYLSDKLQDQMINMSGNKYDGNSLHQLTNRELEIARLLVKGERTSSISEKLSLKLSTVSTHKNRIFEKLKIDNIYGLITEFKFDS